MITCYPRAARRQAGRDRFLEDRSDAGLGANRRHLQGFAASERGAAVPHLVAAQGCAAAGRVAAAVLAQTRQQISGLHQQYRIGGLSAQALRGLDRADKKQRPREIAGRAIHGCRKISLSI